jgi:hypothetical protein
MVLEVSTYRLTRATVASVKVSEDSLVMHEPACAEESGRAVGTGNHALL